MATTSPDNLYYPTGSDQIAPLESLLASMQSSTQTAIINRFKTVAQAVASASIRNSLFPSPVANNQVYRTDVGQIDRYNGSAWQTINQSFNADPLSSAQSIPASGTLGIVSALTLAAVPWARKVSVFAAGTTTAFSGTNQVDVVLRKDGNAVKAGRLYSPGTANAYFTEIVPANVSTSYQVVATAGGGTTATFTNNGQYTYMTIDTVSL